MVATTSRSTPSSLYRIALLCLLMLSHSVKSMTMTKSAGNRLVVYWFRQDLRLHDNPALVHAIKIGDPILPVVCLDPKSMGDKAQTPYGNLKLGPKRAKFLVESVTDLRQSLQSLGSGLVVAHEAPADFFGRLAKCTKESNMSIHVCLQKEVLKEEVDAVKSVKTALVNSKHAKVDEIWGSTLYDLGDITNLFDESLHSMPDVFTPFRNKVEKNCKIGSPLSSPSRVPLPASNTPCYQLIKPLLQSMPSLSDLGYTKEQIQFANAHDSRSVMEFKGGETAALARVKDYVWDKDLLKDYFDTRNGMLGADYSTKFSPWLAHGCLSPRQVAKECQEYEKLRVANKSTYWVVFELLWRDFCKFFCMKHGNRVFFPSGTVGKKKDWSTFPKNEEAWKEGRTGYPLVDANMRELKATGFMSNRGRQNVASFLALDLNHDWRVGADWFESNLIDHDVYSNYYNWCAAAGMTGGRVNRFNIVKQSKDYDAHGDYVRTWCQELNDLPTSFVHEPWKMNQFQQAEFGCRLGVDYPPPLIPPFQPKSNPNNKGGKNNGGGNYEKQRKRNNSKLNRHQKYEMKSLKPGQIEMK